MDGSVLFSPGILMYLVLCDLGDKGHSEDYLNYILKSSDGGKAGGMDILDQWFSTFLMPRSNAHPPLA